MPFPKRYHMKLGVLPYVVNFVWHISQVTFAVIIIIFYYTSSKLKEIIVNLLVLINVSFKCIKDRRRKINLLRAKTIVFDKNSFSYQNYLSLD